LSSYIEIEKKEGIAILKRLPSENKFEYSYKLDSNSRILFSLDMQNKKIYIRTLIQRGSIIDSFDKEEGENERV